MLLKLKVSLPKPLGDLLKMVSLHYTKLNFKSNSKTDGLFFILQSARFLPFRRLSDNPH